MYTWVLSLIATTKNLLSLLFRLIHLILWLIWLQNLFLRCAVFCPLYLNKEIELVSATYNHQSINQLSALKNCFPKMHVYFSAMDVFINSLIFAEGAAVQMQPQTDVRCIHVYENQRWNPMAGYTDRYTHRTVSIFTIHPNKSQCSTMLWYFMRLVFNQAWDFKV